MSRLLLTLAVAALCSCAVGPNFKKPDAPPVKDYLAQPLPDQTGTDAQKYVAGQDIPGQWWTLFHSTALDDLVQQSLKSNPTLFDGWAARNGAFKADGQVFTRAQ